MQIKAYKLRTKSPSDISGLVDLFDRGLVKPEEVICIIGKTEGNGGRNDFTRDLAMQVFEDLFSDRMNISRKEVTEKVIFSLSGGCEGVVSPHIVVFALCEDDKQNQKKASTGKRLALATGFTREFKPGEIGRMAQVEETARVIKSLVEELKVDSVSDVHFVQMKGAIPSYSYEEGVAAAKAGRAMRSDMVYSRGASALGAAVALGEVRLEDLSDDSICSDWDKYSSTASCSAKPGLLRTEVMVMGNSPAWTGELVINGGILKDMIDADSVRTVLGGLGIEVKGQASPEQTERLVGIFGKSEADPRGEIRGQRHTMLTDDDISDTRYSRCVLASVVASVVGDTAIYISTRSEHHGPLGGGTLAVIARA